MLVSDWPLSRGTDSSKAIYLAENLNLKHILKTNTYFETKRLHHFPVLAINTVALIIINVFTP